MSEASEHAEAWRLADSAVLCSAMQANEEMPQSLGDVQEEPQGADEGEALPSEHLGEENSFMFFFVRKAFFVFFILIDDRCFIAHIYLSHL